MNFGFDIYDINARLRPAALAALPIGLAIVTWLQGADTYLSSSLGVLGFAAGALFLSRVARIRGRKVQSRIFSSLGGAPSVVLLRHRNYRLNSTTKSRYHGFLRDNGLHVPSAEEESSTPDVADDYYVSCSDWLREYTRDKTKFPLVRQENIDFGFRRNLYGLRPVAIATLVTITVVDLVIIGFQIASSGTYPTHALALGVFCIIALLSWVFVVTLEFVCDAGWSYAERLLASCEQTAG